MKKFIRLKYAVVEGIDFSGKSRAAKILASLLGARITAEPYCETPESMEFKRKLCSNTMTKEEELQGYCESRKWVFRDVIWPHLQDGKMVISDRNVLTSMIYQSSGDVSYKDIYNFNKDELAKSGFDIRPQLIFFMDIDHDEFMKRLNDAASSGREVNAKDLMFRDKDLFDSYRQKYIDSLEYLRSHEGVFVHRLTPKEVTEENLMEVLEAVESRLNMLNR